MRILIMTEQNELKREVEKFFNKNNFIVDFVETIQDAEYYLDVRSYDAIIFDRNISELDDNYLLSVILNEFGYNKSNIIILGLNSEDKQQRICSEIDFLRTAATDYMYIDSINEEIIEILYLRIISILRLRSIIYKNNSKFIFNLNEYSIVYDSKTLKLTKDEFSLLRYLSLNSGINSKEFIADAIYECPELEDLNKISRIVNSIRAKTEEAFKIDFIETFPRRGYKLINN